MCEEFRAVYTSLAPMFMIGYSLFSLSEWTLVLLEAGFDAVSILDFRRLDIQVVERNKEDDDGTGTFFTKKMTNLSETLIHFED